MNKLTRLVAALELLLILPASLFMSALVDRSLAWLPFGLAHTSGQIVAWYAGRVWSLWVLLILLPLAGLGLGCAALLWRRVSDEALRQAARRPLPAVRTHLAAWIVAAETLAAGVFLAIAVVHVLMN